MHSLLCLLILTPHYCVLFLAGSVEMSPPSESSSPPSYLKWTESISYLLEDGEGAALFRKYLDEQNLEHMTFWYVPTTS